MSTREILTLAESLSPEERAAASLEWESRWCWHCGGPQGECECSVNTEPEAALRCSCAYEVGSGGPIHTPECPLADGTDAGSGCEDGRHWREWADEIAIDADGEVCAYEGGAYWTGVEWVPMDDFDGLRFETIATVGPIPIAFARQLQFRVSRRPAPARAASLASPNPKEEP